MLGQPLNSYFQRLAKEDLLIDSTTDCQYYINNESLEQYLVVSLLPGYPRWLAGRLL